MQNPSDTQSASNINKSQWLDSGQQQFKIDSTVPRFIPVRSVSTINFLGQKEGSTVCASAPFPSLPSRRDLQEVKSQTEQEIKRYEAELRSLKSEMNNIQRTLLVPPEDSNSANENGIHQYRGMLISDALFKSVLKANKKKKMESEGKVMKGNSYNEFRNIQEFPMYKRVIDGLRINVLPVFYHEFVKKELMKEQKQYLANKYIKRKLKWENKNKVLDDYSSRMNSKSYNWPPEFPKELPIIDDSIRLKWASPDQEMYISEEDKKDNCYFNTNGYVEDPVSSYKEYKERIVWTDEEKNIFIEKYRQYPKKFEKIQDSLPEKTHKEIVEFYYQYKYELGLRENEGLTKKRGGRRKIVSEGSSKKNY